MRLKKIIFETDINTQHSDTFCADNTNITEGIFTISEVENGEDRNEENRDCVVANNQNEEGIEISSQISGVVQLRNDDFKMEVSLKYETKMELDGYILSEEEISIDDAVGGDDIEVHEFKCPVDELQIKTESVSYDVQLRNYVLPGDDDSKIEESKEKTETVHFEPKTELDDCILKEEISIDDATEDDSNTFEEYSGRYADTHLLCKEDREFKQQKSNELGFTAKFHPKIVDKGHSFKKSIEKLCTSRNTSYQPIKIDKNQLGAEVEGHFSNFLFSDKCNVFKCELCEFKSKYKYNFKKHSLVHSNECNIYSCQLCNFKTKYKSSLTNHLVVHSDECNLFKCNLCDFKTKHKICLKTHLILHSKECNLYKCELCEFKTKHKNNLKTHLKLVHSNDCTVFKCEHCNYKTKHKSKLKYHLIMHSDECYSCVLCDFKTKHKNSLISHSIVHSNECNLYKCDLCDFKTKYKYYLKKHSIIHSDECNLFKCNVCNFKTKYKHSLKKHLIVHSDQCNLYACGLCDFKTKRKASLRRHLMCNSNNCNLYKCEHCDFQTKHKQWFNTHLIMHSEDCDV